MFGIYLLQKFKWVSLLAGAFDKMLNFKVRSPQFSYVSTKQVLNLKYLLRMRYWIGMGLFTCFQKRRLLNWSHIAEYLWEVIFQLGNGKTLCDLYVHSENLKIEFYLLSSHFELLINKLPRIINKGKAETK